VIELFPNSLAQVAPHPNQIGTYTGIALDICSLAVLTSAPITVAMVANYGWYIEAFVFSGGVMIARTGLVLCGRYFYARKGEWIV